MVFLSKPVYVLFTMQLSFDTISKKSHIHMAEKIYQYIFEARNFHPGFLSPVTQICQSNLSSVPLLLISSVFIHGYLKTLNNTKSYPFKAGLLDKTAGVWRLKPFFSFLPQSFSY